LQSQVWLMDFQAMRWLMNKEIAGQSGNDHPTSSPTGVFKTADGHMNIAAMGNDIFERLCRVIGAEHLIKDDRFKTVPLRGKNRSALNQAINACTQLQSTEVWIERMNQAGVPCGPILNMQQTMQDPQVRHLNLAQRIKHPKLGDIEVVGQAVQMSRSRLREFTAAPDSGEHNAQIYAELGIDATALKALKDQGIV
jgi:crotonobetainyl-CoA:carnitine CoA-transferase CaiB-like acyl-CoA transferase